MSALLHSHDVILKGSNNTIGVIMTAMCRGTRRRWPDILLNNSTSNSRSVGSILKDAFSML